MRIQDREADARCGSTVEDRKDICILLVRSLGIEWWNDSASVDEVGIERVVESTAASQIIWLQLRGWKLPGSQAFSLRVRSVEGPAGKTV